MGAVETWLQYLREKKNFIEKELHGMGADIESIISEVPQTFFELKNRKSLKELRVACIMDPFSYDSYKEECNLMQITPDHWEEEINTFHPDILFVESAWQGKDNLWYRKIANISKEYFAVTSYCQDKGIPVIFWNKEDPVWTDTFIPAAKCADIVFTTDIDCIPKYKEYLNNNKVYLLHFAAQPKVHNPIEKYERKDKFCFAGAYYHRYPKRAKVFDEFSEIFIDLKGFDIYDRNYQNSRPEHAFPEIYNPYILGRLEPEEIDVAYKGYYYGINMNSVDQSQTMFARRVFEMLASNTVTVGNFSRGVRNFFGDLTISTNDDKTLKESLKRYCDDEMIYRKYRLLGLRRVLVEHLYEDRLSYIVEKVFGVKLKQPLPQVSLIMQAGENVEKGIRMFSSFNYVNKTLYIIGKKIDGVDNDNIKFLTSEEAEKISISEIADKGFVSNLCASNYYGKNYLLDLCLTKRYSDAMAYGKGAFYQFDGRDFLLYGKEHIYGKIKRLLTDRGIFSGEMQIICNLSLKEFANLKYVDDSKMMSIDEFNFCENYSGDQCETVDDLVIVNQGIHMNEIASDAEKIHVSVAKENGRKITCDEIYAWSKASWKDGVTCDNTNVGLLINSSLGEEQNKYVYMNESFDIYEHMKKGKLNLFFGGMGNMNFLGVCVFYDAGGNKLSPVFPPSNVVSSYDVPEGAKTFKLGVRLRGSGTYTLQQIVLGIEKNPNEMGSFVSAKDVLLLTNYYPSADILYRNMFVHKRIRSYKDVGQLCDIMEWNSYSHERYREFEQIDIISGQEDTLCDILSKGRVKTVCIHFLDVKMWEVLKLFAREKRIIIWIHGAEIEPWWRRKCNYTSEEEEESAKKASEPREKFWKEFFSVRHNYNLHFVFVSRHFMEEVCEDYAVELNDNEYSIIHNCIDTELFSYKRKDAEQRKRILSIRPYAALNYANDLTVKCILELSKRKFFHELSFSLYGDGILFDETVKPLKKFKNVEINKRFLRQSEIADMHKAYGIFLIPTRLDTQGVSRDEAMASGMVVITNAVAAVPEFTDDSCAMVVPAEDYVAMADAVEKLYKNPTLFLEYSLNARKRVESQTSRPYTINREIELIYRNVE